MKIRLPQADKSDRGWEVARREMRISRNWALLGGKKWPKWHSQRSGGQMEEDTKKNEVARKQMQNVQLGSNRAVLDGASLCQWISWTCASSTTHIQAVCVCVCVRHATLWFVPCGMCPKNKEVELPRRIASTGPPNCFSINFTLVSGRDTPSGPHRQHSRFGPASGLLLPC